MTSGFFGRLVMRVTCAAIEASPLRKVSSPRSAGVAGDFLPARAHAGAERLGVGDGVVEEDVGRLPALLLEGPFGEQRALRLAGIRGRIGERADALHAELRIRRAGEGDDVALLRDVGAGRAEIEIAREEDRLGALADHLDGAVGAERRLGLVVELDDLDRLAEHAAGGVDLVDRELGAGDGVGVDRLEPAAERHHQPEHRLVGGQRQEATGRARP